MSELQEIFDTLKASLMKYQPPFTVKVDDAEHYDLWSIKNVVIEGRKRNEIYFAGLVIRKDYVGFYYMPVYTDEAIKDLFRPELLSRLKGKSCFHIKKLDAQILPQIEDALKNGFELYQQKGWV